MKRRDLFFLSLFLLTVSAVTGRSEEPEPVDQHELNRLAVEDPKAAFEEAFEAGDELTEADFRPAAESAPTSPTACCSPVFQEPIWRDRPSGPSTSPCEKEGRMQHRASPVTARRSTTAQAGSR